MLGNEEGRVDGVRLCQDLSHERVASIGCKERKRFAGELCELKDPSCREGMSSRERRDPGVRPEPLGDDAGLTDVHCSDTSIEEPSLEFC